MIKDHRFPPCTFHHIPCSSESSKMKKYHERIICVPGQRLCISDKTNTAGPGTYEQQGYIYSKLAGSVKIINEKNNTRVIEVCGMTEQSIIPAPGDIVTAMVTVVNQRFCKCSIKCIGDIVLTRPYRGILKKEDVRFMDRDKVEMYKSFRPGDIILARVVSFGNSLVFCRNLVLLTENSLKYNIMYTHWYSYMTEEQSTTVCTRTNFLTSLSIILLLFELYNKIVGENGSKYISCISKTI